MLITKFNTFLHKHYRTMFGILAVLLIFPFVLWGTRGVGDRQPKKNAGFLYGRKVTDREFHEARTAGFLQYVMMTGDMQASGMGDMLTQEAWRRMVLLHVADELGIRVSEEEIAGYLQGMPVFQTEGRFDPQRLNGFVANALPRMRVSTEAFQQGIRDDLRLRHVRELVLSTAHVTPSELRTWYDQREESFEVALATVDIDVDAVRGELTEEEIEAYFQERLAQFRIPEKRTVRYVRFGIDEARAADGIEEITDAEIRARYEADPVLYADDDGNPRPFEEVAAEVRAEIERQRARVWASDRATLLSVDLITEEGEPVEDFDAVLATNSIDAVTSEPFERGRTPADLPAAPGLAGALAELGDDKPYTDPIAVGDEYYMFARGEVIPSRDAELDEMRDRVVDAVAALKARERARERATESIDAIRSALADGKEIAEAFTAAGLEAQTPEPFSMGSPPYGLALPPTRIVDTARGLAPGEVSDPVPGATNLGIVALISRQPPTDEQFDDARALLTNRYLVEKSRLVFEEWILDQVERADLQPAPGFGGPVEPAAEEEG